MSLRGEPQTWKYDTRHSADKGTVTRCNRLVFENKKKTLHYLVVTLAHLPKLMLLSV